MKGTQKGFTIEYWECGSWEIGRAGSQVPVDFILRPE